jgi:hypothetical protein
MLSCCERCRAALKEKGWVFGLDIHNFFTIGEIARRADCPVHRVAYLLRTRRIAPAFRAGGTRVFTEQQVAALIHDLSTPTEADVKPQTQIKNSNP